MSKPVYIHAICPTCGDPYDWSKEDLCCGNMNMLVYESNDEKFGREVMLEYAKMNDDKVKGLEVTKYV
tara:strand:- start:766 stop:969 length:204 start_codon:yes stop_codon:yes gene_type:complete